MIPKGRAISTAFCDGVPFARRRDQCRRCRPEGRHHAQRTDLASLDTSSNVAL
jgi:hypothetical protein